MSGNFLSCIKGVKDPFKIKKEGGISLETLQRKRASSCVEGRISWYFLSCGRKLGVPLELQQGPQGPTRVGSGKPSVHAGCKGPLEIALQLVPSPRSSSGIEAGTSGFLSSADMDLGVPIEFEQASQPSSRVETASPLSSGDVTVVSGFLSSTHRDLWLSLEVPQGCHTCHRIVS